MDLRHLMRLFGILCFLCIPTIGLSYTLEENFFDRQNRLFSEEFYLVPLFNPLDIPEEKTKPETTTDVRFTINLPSRRLTIYNGGQSTRSYPVTIGSFRYKTPIGPREFSKLIWNPWWYPPNSKWAKNAKDTPPGPRNPLGKVKISLGGPILLHGTNNPRSIGRAVSHACMRMFNEDIIELATWLQNKFYDQSEDLLLKDHMENWMWRSYTVKLKKALPVDITYKTVDVDGDNLVIYPDVYRRHNDLYLDAITAVGRIGIIGSDINAQLLPEKHPEKEPIRVPILSVLKVQGDKLAGGPVFIENH